MSVIHLFNKTHTLQGARQKKYLQCPPITNLCFSFLPSYIYCFPQKHPHAKRIQGCTHSTGPGPAWPQSENSCLNYYNAVVTKGSWLWEQKRGMQIWPMCELSLKQQMGKVKGKQRIAFRTEGSVNKGVEVSAWYCWSVNAREQGRGWRSQMKMPLYTMLRLYFTWRQRGAFEGI